MIFFFLYVSDQGVGVIEEKVKRALGSSLQCGSFGEAELVMGGIIFGKTWVKFGAGS